MRFVKLCHEQCMNRQRDGEGSSSDQASLDGCAFARLRDALAHRAGGARTFLHTQEPEMLGRIDGIQIKTCTLALNAQLQFCTLHLNLYRDGNVSCVLLHVPESLFANSAKCGGPPKE